MKINHDENKTTCVACYYNDGEVLYMFFDTVEEAEKYGKAFDKNFFSRGYEIIPAYVLSSH